MGHRMTGRVEIVFQSRRFIVDALMGVAALLLALAAFTTTTDPYLLAIVSAALIGLGLALEPRTSLRRQLPTERLGASEWQGKAIT
jgi:hypothetical protein